MSNHFPTHSNPHSTYWRIKTTYFISYVVCSSSIMVIYCLYYIIFKKLGGLYNLLIFGTMTPVSYTGIQGITYEYKK